MKLLKKAMNAVFLAVIISTTFQCSSSKTALVPKDTQELKLNKPVVFQEWYAGINVGGTGINMFIPKFESEQNIKVDSVYFRNMKGKLMDRDDMYSVILKNDSQNYAANPSNAKTNPFNLASNVCMISYTENDQIKYLKVVSIVEKAGIYYENGPPSIYETIPSTVIATVDED